MVRLGDYVSIKTGKLDANASSPNGAYPFFTCAVTPLKIDTYTYDCECVLVAGNGDLNVKYYNGKFDAYQRTYIIESKNKDELDVRYLYCFLDLYVETLRKESIGGVIKYIKLGNLTGAKIHLPSLREQHQVVADLDKVSVLIAKRREQLSKLDELVKSRFIELFGDAITNSKNLPTMPLGKVCYLKAGVTTSADEIFDYSAETPIPCYGGNGIRGYVKEATQKGEYPIIGRQGALCGNVQFATGEFHATEHAVLVKSLQGDNLVWLYYLLKYLDLYRYHTGAAQPGLSVKVLNTIDVPKAKKGLQDQFAAFAQQTEKLKLTIQQSLDTWETTKKALMQKHFG